jgi:DNA-binding NtrC family response regulator
VTRARVLIVDDKATYVALFRRILASDIEVIGASDGLDALETIARERFDVVVSDVRMPRADGLTLVRKLRELDPDAQVLLMTAYGTISDAVCAMKLGACDYLTKPFDPDLAAALVEKAIARRRRGAVAHDGSGGALVVDEAARQRIEHEVSAVGPDAELRSEEPQSLPDGGAAPQQPLTALSYREAIAVERERTAREYLVALLRDVRGNVTQAAERAGIERESFHRLMKRHGIRSEEFRRR